MIEDVNQKQELLTLLHGCWGQGALPKPRDKSIKADLVFRATVPLAWTVLRGTGEAGTLGYIIDMMMRCVVSKNNHYL